MSQERREEALSRRQEANNPTVLDVDRLMAVVPRIVELIERRVRSQSKPAESDKRVKNMRLGLEKLFTPISQQAQLVKYGYVRAGETDPEVLKRANWLVDQHRRRGRKDMKEVLSNLVSSGLVGDDEALEFSRATFLVRSDPATDSEHRNEGDADA